MVGAAAGGAMAGPMGMSLGAKTGVLAIAAGGAIAGEVAGPTLLQPPNFGPSYMTPTAPPFPLLHGGHVPLSISNQPPRLCRR